MKSDLGAHARSFAIRNGARFPKEGEIGVWEMNHPDLKATRTFGDDNKVRPAARTFSASVVNNGFIYTFPAHPQRAICNKTFPS